MTIFLLDVASYQGSLAAADVRRAGFTVVNLKVSHGLTRKSVHPDITGWVDDCRALGLAVSTFHFMSGNAAGDAQAEYAYARIRELGLEYGTAHQCDVESSPPPTLAQVRAYLIRMTELLRRPVALYTGDWWWKARPGWRVDDLTPYLWAAPNVGYLGTYPGDTGPAWTAGYGGWPRLSVMQFGVGKLRFPDGGTGGIDVSKSAIRDGAVWRDLTLGRPGMSYAPDKLKAARTLYIDLVRAHGYDINPLSVGIVGDDSHANAGTSYHLGKDALKSTAYSIVESSRDRNGLTNAASGLDLGWFSFKVDGKTHNLRTFSAWLVAQCKAGAADTLDIREVIYSTDGDTVKRWDRLGKRTTGDSSHTSHTHISYFRDSESRDKTALIRRYFNEIDSTEEDMPLTNADAALVAEEVVDRLFARHVMAGETDLGTYQGVTATTFTRAGSTANVQLPAVANALSAVLANVQADDADLATLRAAIDQASDETVSGVVTALANPALSDAQVAAALRAVLGSRAGAVGALLTGQ